MHDARSVPIAGHVAAEAAMRDDSAEGQESVEVNGVQVTSDSSLRTTREACKILGIGLSGGREKCFKRLWKHLERIELAEGVRLQNEQKAAQARDPIEVPRVKEPSTQDRQVNELTHTPKGS